MSDDSSIRSTHHTSTRHPSIHHTSTRHPSIHHPSILPYSDSIHSLETVVGWYHSHPGFGCWLSSVDINTQQSFEQLTPRAVAVVIDPIQSVKGKVVIDAFRLINPQTLMLGQEPRQTTSNVGHLNKPSIQALIHGLNRHYYSIAVGYLKGRGGGSANSAIQSAVGSAGGVGGEEGMLMNLHKSVWTEALTMNDFKSDGDRNLDKLKKLVSLADGYEKRVKEETELSKDQLRTRYVGKVDPKKRALTSLLSPYHPLHHHHTDTHSSVQTSSPSPKTSSKTISSPSRAK